MNQVYQIITDRILKLMDQDGLIWVKDWKGRQAGNSPKNYLSGREYTGLNFLLLSSLPFDRPEYLTFNQVKELGGSIRKGEHSTPVIFWKKSQYQKETEPGTFEDKTGLILRYYNVFNISQVDGIPVKEPAEKIQPSELEKIQAAELVIFAMPKRPEIICNDGDRAYYSRLHDTVTVPEIGYFKTQAGYYSTLFHELGHSTGHKNRLGRKELENISFFGDVDYSREELTAELTAAYVCAEIGLSNEHSLKNSAAYISGWKRKLKDDPQAFIYSSSQAMKAADFILNRTQLAAEPAAE